MRSARRCSWCWTLVLLFALLLKSNTVFAKKKASTSWWPDWLSSDSSRRSASNKPKRPTAKPKRKQQHMVKKTKQLPKPKAESKKRNPKPQANKSKPQPIVRPKLPPKYQTIGPIGSSKMGYRWQATVDVHSGVCNSKETSPWKRGDDDVDLYDAFCGYPRWLCRFLVTFGLLRARDTVDGTDICFLGTTAFQFGKPHQLGVFTTSSSTVKTILPIQGGWLTKQPTGALIFSQDNDTLETSVVHYRPFRKVDGKVNTLRSFLYLHSQSIVHGYVMWRFHRYCGTFRRPGSVAGESQPQDPPADTE